MPLIRPDLAAALTRWRDVLIGGAVALAGLWVATLGGLFYLPLGGLVLATGLALAWIGWRRLRFQRATAAPGVVEVTEGQITYLAPAGGGFAAFSELVEIALAFGAAGRAHWRLNQRGAPPLAIPVAAAGADALFDVFVALPGADAGRIIAAQDRTPAQGGVTVWRRSARLALV